MAPDPPHPIEEPREPVPDYQQALSNPELLSALDLALLELEKRLFRYAKVGPELLEMADEGLVLAARAKARLGQSLSAAHSIPRDTCRWWGWASGVPPARAPREIPSLASRRGRRIRSRHPSSSDAARDAERRTSTMWSPNPNAPSRTPSRSKKAVANGPARSGCR